MIFINEWFPNPIGDDVKGEFVELFNNGNKPVNLSGWFLKNESGKSFELSGVIAAEGYLVLRRSETRLTLKNNDGTLSLYDSSGVLMDQSAFVGAAPSGQSFSRINYEIGPSEHFMFTDPTPGVANDITVNVPISNNQYPFGVPLPGASPNVVMAIAMALSLGVALIAIMVYALKQDEDLSELFFGRDQRIW